MFKTKGLVLKIQRIRDSHFRIIILTREYGRISCWHKVRNCCYDIGDITNLTIERSKNINTIHCADNIISTSSNNWNYDSIIGLLEFLSLLWKVLPESMPHPSIFDDYNTLLETITQGINPKEHHFILLKIRTLRTLGILNPKDIEGSPLLQYIHNNIRTTPINKIISSKALDNPTLERLNQAIYKSIESLN